jgi:transporter family-2 protein
LKSLLTLVAFTAGAATSAQAAINAQLGQRFLHPMQAALASFTIGTLACLAICLMMRLTWPSFSRLASVPWWLWLGGLLGTCYVLTSIIVTQRIGVAAMLALVIAGQMAMSVLIDHYGWFQIAPRALTLPRAIGAVMVIGGVALMMLKTPVD